ncbi:Rtr1/RPAP2 family [Nesidiocoris tenuis]|uniref:RNA polymerase II subunit B1 CTD phosphatase RPAP2 homolog n=1 Tax=Nesidiocoris tenuis TaxID=355587 RepID=A0ABN7BGP7_9HEMI|nr:Rtr1/RPAP2 family [Nesidiocoris tenuis]
MLDNLTHINQSHFQDAVEERAITKCCGYPLCDAAMTNIPSKQFHISTKQNKVFDITDRKNYCSNQCYKAGVYLKEQLFTSPLWLRDCEDVVTYKTYDPAPSSGITGQEVDLGHLVPAKVENDETIDKEAAEVEETLETVKSSLNDIGDDFSDSEEPFEDAREELDDIADKIRTATLQCDEADDVFHLSSSSLPDQQGDKGECDNNGNETCNNSHPGKKNLDKRKPKNQSSAEESHKKKVKPNLPVGMKVEQFVAEWFTVDSLMFIYGEAAVKDKFAKFGSPLNEGKNSTKIRDTYMYERYEEICRRLNVLEIKDREAQAPSKPLPNYDKLKAEAKELELKVRSFYKGGSAVSFEVPEEETKEDGDDLQPILPLVDRHAIRATRRRIVLSKLNKTLPDILSALNLSQFSLRHEVQELVYTMSLSATNIVMKPAEWNLVALILIRIMTIKDESLKQAFHSDLTNRRLVNLLMTFNLDLSYLERQVLNINDVELIVRNSGRASVGSCKHSRAFVGDLLRILCSAKQFSVNGK